MDPLEAVGDRKLRAAFSFVSGQTRPVTADELAASLGTHRNVAHSRLERLATAGLLTRGYERRTGRVGPGAGRPAKTYAVASQLRSIEFPERHYEKLVALIVDALPTRSRRERLRALGIAFADQLAETVRPASPMTLAGASEHVCAAVRELGFHATVMEVGEGAAVIETAACPLRPIVRERPGLAEIDRGMWTGLAARALEGVEAVSIECDTHACRGEGPCRVTLTLRPGEAQPEQAGRSLGR